MASREFLKILSSARLGDVLAQQKLASAYLTGSFKTPIQPGNALIWLEKCYLSLKNQSLEEKSSEVGEVSKLYEQITQIPLSETLQSPSFGFAWDIFWELSHANSTSAKWQLANLLINPSNEALQGQVEQWLKSKNTLASNNKVSALNFEQLQELARQYLQELADSESAFTHLAKELLIALQPKNQTLSSLWDSWLVENNEEALHRSAELGLTVAKLTLGLRLARIDQVDQAEKIEGGKSNASLKKAAHWLELAAKDGDRDAWFALGEIYRRPQFSGYSAAESDRCFDRAADLGHPQAQFRKGANLWRKREKIEEPVRGLQASYWIWQAQQQGVAEATELLQKILESVPNPKRNDWYELALLADHALNHHAEHKLDEEWILMCHRIIIANQFQMSKAELLLCEVSQLQHEHCVVVDIRWELPKILPRLIQIETISQRRSLLAAGKAFSGTALDQEGNLRQRRYRFDRVTAWLNTNITKRQIDESDVELV
ncbi:sel1 repeat family protein [Polynucleobacter paneuropaeus]|nr:sel1 repeat family protein [Polynucleobacter paneuropaeus]MBT8539250.1 sel1 repeat family protein [Polynucleobacter paneuropaeus]